MIYLVRHAPLSAEGLCYGQSDTGTVLVSHVDASSRVERQLRDLQAEISLVVSSPWERTAGLAREVATRLAVPLVEDAGLSELAFGEWEGRPWSEIEAEDPAHFRHWMENYLDARPPRGENAYELLARVDRVARALRDGTLVVTHAGVIRALRARARMIAFDAAMAERVGHLVVETLPVDTP